jgi:NAD(P)-dependent dehydrogenase (short-subunit alcohol dehydrogenase family)
MDASLSGMSAIITGCRGIGRGIALAYANSGARVALVDKDATTAQGTAEEVRAAGADALPITGDVRLRADCERAVAETVDTLGGVDILVNCAIETGAGRLVDHTDEDFKSAWESGVLAAFRMMQLCYPYLRVAAPRSSVINFGSAAGTEGHAGLAAYAATKEAIRALSVVAAREWGPEGIRVNVIVPFANSPGMLSWAQAEPELHRATLARTPLQRAAETETDIGAVAVFLASEMGRYITANTIMADGGGSMFR